MTQDPSLDVMLPPRQTEPMGDLVEFTVRRKVFSFHINIDIDENDEPRILYRSARQFTVANYVALEQELSRLMTLDIKRLVRSWDRPAVDGPIVTPLSIDNDENCVIIMILTRDNLSFSSNYAPFDVQRDFGKYYIGARRVKSEGTVEHNNSATVNNSKIAFFLANTSDQRNDNKRQRVRFNIYIDMKIAVPGSSDAATLLPIVIDPDIGHPGGSKPR